MSAPENLNEEDFKRYCNDTSKCPYCWEETVETDDQDFPETAVFVQTMRCTFCKKSWAEVYRMEAVEQIEDA